MCCVHFQGGGECRGQHNSDSHLYYFDFPSISDFTVLGVVSAPHIRLSGMNKQSVLWAIHLNLSVTFVYMSEFIIEVMT